MVPLILGNPHKPMLNTASQKKKEAPWDSGYLQRKKQNIPWLSAIDAMTPLQCVPAFPHKRGQGLIQ